MSGTSDKRVRLAIEDLHKSYGDVDAVDGIDVEVHSGEIFGLIGPDGAGKTTTMRIVCGLLLPDSGGTKVMGFDPVAEHRKVRENIGYMPQRFSLYPDLTVEENLRFFADLYSVTRQQYEEREPKLMQFSRLGKFRKRRAGALSGGMKQKLALICTLIHTPEVLVLDEPTFGVDPVSRQEFWDILKNLASDGLALLVSTAYMDEAGLCDRLGLMHRGKIVRQGTVDEIIRTYPRQLLTISAQNPTAMIHTIREQLPASVEVHRFGDQLHAAFRGTEDRERLIDLVKRAGGEVREIEPTIEDVFVEMASGEEAA